MTDDFNLWDDPWIRVLRPDGGREELGIRATLLRAHELRALHDPSPLTVAGIHRLLTAILQAISAPDSLGEIAAVLDAERFDAARIDAFGAQFRARFGLFDPAAPFMQTADVPALPDKDAKTIAYLLIETPAGTNRAHFQHVTDDMHGLCPACCARALVVVPAFASSGGSGIKPSINGVPPIYMLPVGATLHQSLARSLTVADYQPPQADTRRPTEAAWSGAVTIPKAQERTDIGYLESLTFPARRVRLYPHMHQRHCTQCGVMTAVAVTKMLYEMGVSRPKASELWRDPFAAFRVGGKEKLLSVKPYEGRAMWREYGTLLLSDGALRPAIVAQMSDMIDGEYVNRAALLSFRCVGIRTDGKAKNYEWFDATLDVPPALLCDPAGAQVVRRALDHAETLGREMGSIFTKAFQPHKEREWFKTLRQRMQATYWTQLAAPFRALVQETGATIPYDTLDRQWDTQVLQTGGHVARALLAQVGDEADLLMRRVRAEHRIGGMLGTYRKEWGRD